MARLAPYLWRYRWRVGAALLMVTGAKLSNVGVPILLKDLVDRMNIKAGDPLALVVVPVGLLLAYGLLRLMTTVFTELRELVFSKATQGATRQVALQTFEHLHSLSLRFHLERQTGGMTRDIERGVRAIEALITYSLYSIIPTLVEVALVLAILGTRFDAGFVWITLAALGAYVVFTVWVTEWRTRFRVEANSADSAAHNHAIDSLLNYETVKYFGNEGFESRRYDESLRRYQRSRLKSQSSLSLLNTGQQLIIGIGLVAMLWRATAGVADGHLSIGDLVMINAFMIQLYIPLNFLGVIYRELKQNLTDLHRMFALMDRPREVADAPGAPELHTNGPVDVSFEHVGFAYESERPILHDVTFSIPAGKTVAVVGPSGSGKSTLARLLYRFYDPCLVPPRSAASHAALPPRGCRRLGAARRRRRPHPHRRAGHPHRHPGQRAPRHRHRAAGHRAVQRHHRLQHPLRPPGRERRGGAGGGARRAHPRLHRVHAERLRHHGGRARAEAVGRREATRGHCPHPAEGPAGADLRRGHQRAGLGQRARHPGRAGQRRAGQDHPGHRPPAVHHRRRAPDPGDEPGAHRRARHPPGAAGRARRLRPDVGHPAQPSAKSGRRSGAVH
ncbi:ABC transporter transmembrane domain-containing protein [Ottowia pentelensis]|uniref:ABC transporter transmembrane domain-containing protein n=1 Tax=Ottowia pentelensis TaxID=511108 RepID=UPI0036443BA1